MKKSVLFTTHQLVDYAGSEVNILELSKEFWRRGWEVDVASFVVGLPIVHEFEKIPVKVYDALNEELLEKKYDLIWAQHSPCIEYIVLNKKITAPKIVFSSLSFFEPLEAPPFFSNKLTFTFANSNENALHIKSYGISNIKVFPNFIPEEFINTKLSRKLNDKLERIAIVSNHVPSELIELKRDLSNESISVDIYGFGHRFEKITPEILEKYDVVITIGKTVQYSLGLGIPVFIYDHFGGPGWLTLANFDKCLWHNFSGRSKTKKYDSGQLKTMIMDGYEEVCKSQYRLSQKAIKLFSLRRNLDEILEQIDEKREVDQEGLKVFTLIKRYNDLYIRELQTKHWYQKLYNELASSQKEERIQLELAHKRAQELENQRKVIETRLSEIESTLFYKTYWYLKRLINKSRL